MSQPIPASGTDWRRTPCHVQLQSFHGPMELLLHLTRTGEIDAADLPIIEIVRQYEAYLDLMERIDLEAAGEYLLVAATLTHLKSRRLLPVDPTSPDEETADEMFDDAALRDGLPLLRRAAEHLQEREAAMELVYRRPPDRVAEFAGEQGIDADLFSLVKALQAVLSRVKETATARISRERMSLVDRLNWLVETLHEKRRISFGVLFEGLSDRLTCIITFLALLEVIRLRIARAFMSHREDAILIELIEGTVGSPAPTTEEPRSHV